MNNTKKGLAALAAAGFGLWSSAANAIIIDIGASFNGGAVTEIAGPSPDTNPVVFSTPVGGVAVGTFTVNATGTASSTSLANDFGTTTLDITNTGSSSATLAVYLTASNINGPIGNNLPFISALTSNTLPAGWSVTEATYLDAGNGTLAGGLGTLLDTFTFNAIGVQPPVVTAANTGPGPYSLTEVYTVTAPGCTAAAGSCSALSTIDVAGAPGPIVGAGLPGLLAACGGLIALARRRRQQRA